MIISKLKKIKNKELRKEALEGLVWGLVWGLVGGLLWGLLWGLVLGLLGGLLGGLAGGLLGGLVGGLVGGLLGGLAALLVNFKEAFPFLTGINEIFWLIVGIIVLVEIIFWLDNSVPKRNEDKIKFTIKRKLDALLTTALVLSLVGQIYVLQREIRVSQYVPEIVKLIGYIGLGMIILAIIVGLSYLWIYLNSKRYRNGK